MKQKNRDNGYRRLPFRVYAPQYHGFRLPPVYNIARIDSFVKYQMLPVIYYLKSRPCGRPSLAVPPTRPPKHSLSGRADGFHCLLFAVIRLLFRPSIAVAFSRICPYTPSKILIKQVAFE